MDAPPTPQITLRGKRGSARKSADKENSLDESSHISPIVANRGVGKHPNQILDGVTRLHDPHSLGLLFTEPPAPRRSKPRGSSATPSQEAGPPRASRAPSQDDFDFVLLLKPDDQYRSAAALDAVGTDGLGAMPPPHRATDSASTCPRLARLPTLLGCCRGRSGSGGTASAANRKLGASLTSTGGRDAAPNLSILHAVHAAGDATTARRTSLGASLGSSLGSSLASSMTRDWSDPPAAEGAQDLELGNWVDAPFNGNAVDESKDDCACDDGDDGADATPARLELRRLWELLAQGVVVRRHRPRCTAELCLLYSPHDELLSTVRWKRLKGDESGGWAHERESRWEWRSRGRQLRTADICRVHAAATMEQGFQGTDTLRQSHDIPNIARTFSLVCRGGRRVLDIECLSDNHFELLLAGFMRLLRETEAHGCIAPSWLQTETGDAPSPRNPNLAEVAAAALALASPHHGLVPQTPPAADFLGWTSPGQKIVERLKAAGFRVKKLHHVDWRVVALKLMLPTARLEEVAEQQRIKVGVRGALAKSSRARARTHTALSDGARGARASGAILGRPLRALSRRASRQVRTIGRQQVDLPQLGAPTRDRLPDPREALRRGRRARRAHAARRADC